MDGGSLAVPAGLHHSAGAATRIWQPADHLQHRLPFIRYQLVALQSPGQKGNRLFHVGKPLFGQPLLIEAIAFEKMILQYGGRPDTELGAALRLDPIANRDDDIEIIKGGGFV